MRCILILLLLTLSLSSKNNKRILVPIVFKGNKIVSTSDLEEVVGAKKSPFILFWKERIAKISPKMYPRLKETFKLFYKNEGFYDAHIDTHRENQSIIVTIEEHRPIIIEDVIVDSDLDLSEGITVEAHERFRAKDFTETKKKIHKILLTQGYCSPELSTKAYLDIEKYKAYIKIDLKKKKLCHFGKISIKTKSTTMNDDIILSRLYFEEGDVFNIEKIKESYEALYSLEAFDQLNLDYSKKLYNNKPVGITYKEVSKKIHTRIGLGYATDLKFQGRFYWEYQNYGGNGKKLIFDTVVSKDQKRVENRFFVPYVHSIEGYYLDLLNSVGYSEERDVHNFDERVVFDKLYLIHAGSQWYNSIGLGIEQREIFNASQILNEHFFLIYPFIKLVYDQRDSKINPKNGFYFSHEMEYGLQYSPDSTSYLKYEEELRLIYTPRWEMTFSSVGRMGAISLYKNNMPESKKFFAGGAFTNRAYGYDRLGITESQIKASTDGGFTFANLSLETNFPLYKNFRGAIFSDNTMISDNQGIWEFSNKVISSAGLGFRYLTPLGPFKIDFGMNVHDKSQRAIHFQVGQSF